MVMVSLVGFLLFLTKRTQPCFLVVVIKGVLPIGCLMFDLKSIYPAYYIHLEQLHNGLELFQYRYQYRKCL